MNKISFCTQIKNRLHQFKQVFNANLEEIKSNANTEWIIVDINSEDGVDEFIEPYVCDQIKYYKCIEKISYSIPIAKNFSARLASGDYIFNLDADNFIDYVYLDIINNDYCCLHAHNENLKGTFGRIGCMRSIFYELGGYDESFCQASYHENDLFNRCNLLGYKFKKITTNKSPIENDKTDTARNMNSAMSWKEMQNINYKKAQNNLIKKIINPNKKFTQCKFICNFESEIELKQNF